MSESDSRGSLAAPAASVRDDRSFEIVRIWVVADHQEFVIKPRVWGDPAAWGLLIADLMRHVARAIEKQEGRSYQDALARIREGFEAEMSMPMDPDGPVV